MIYEFILKDKGKYMRLNKAMLKLGGLNQVTCIRLLPNKQNYAYKTHCPRVTIQLMVILLLLVKNKPYLIRLALFYALEKCESKIYINFMIALLRIL